MDDFKITLLAARVNAGLTQVEAARIVGVSDTTILHWEKGVSEPSLSQAIALAEAYKIPIDRIIFSRVKSKEIGFKRSKSRTPC